MNLLIPYNSNINLGKKLKILKEGVTTKSKHMFIKYFNGVNMPLEVGTSLNVIGDVYVLSNTEYKSLKVPKHKLIEVHIKGVRNKVNMMVVPILQDLPSITLVQNKQKKET
jgi:hypothetical protein